jgi:Skp family chaperone for outer membrane proteins
MRSSNRMLSRAVVLLLLAVCLFVGYQAAGTRNMVASPTSVAVVQLRKVMDGIQQRAVIDVRLKEMETTLLAEEQAHTEKVTALRDKLKTLVNNDADRARALAIAQDKEYNDLTNELEVATLNYAAWQRSTLELVDLEKSLVVQELYRNVKDAIAVLAAAEGYQLVLIDDSQGELQTNPEAQMSREAQMFQQLSLRKVLYASPMIDITDDLIVRMNNNFNAGPAGGANQ